MERPSERRRLPPLNALRAFEAAARHLNFSRAADELSVTPGAVSQQIQNLEDYVGAAHSFLRELEALLVATQPVVGGGVRQCFVDIGELLQSLGVLRERQLEPL